MTGLQIAGLTGVDDEILSALRSPGSQQFTPAFSSSAGCSTTAGNPNKQALARSSSLGAYSHTCGSSSRSQPVSAHFHPVIGGSGHLHHGWSRSSPATARLTSHPPGNSLHRTRLIRSVTAETITTRSRNCKLRRRPASTLRRKVANRDSTNMPFKSLPCRFATSANRGATFPRANIVAGSQSLSRNRMMRPEMVLLIKALLRYYR
jgi:hypothetical protein